MKYYIRAFYSDWHEVSKEQYDSFKKNILDGAINVDKNNPEAVKNFLSNHAKEVAICNIDLLEL